MPGNGFRASLSWLHTWAGVLLGGLLLAVFWSGSLVVFDREIDRWMLPSTRLGSPPVDLSLDRLVVPHAQRLAGTAARWSITLPSERTPVIQLEFPNAEGVSTRRFIDPASGELLPDHGSWAATGFLFRSTTACICAGAMSATGCWASPAWACCCCWCPAW